MQDERLRYETTHTTVLEKPQADFAQALVCLGRSGGTTSSPGAKRWCAWGGLAVPSVGLAQALVTATFVVSASYAQPLGLGI